MKKGRAHAPRKNKGKYFLGLLAVDGPRQKCPKRAEKSQFPVTDFRSAAEIS